MPGKKTHKNIFMTASYKTLTKKKTVGQYKPCGIYDPDISIMIYVAYLQVWQKKVEQGKSMYQSLSLFF